MDKCRWYSTFIGILVLFFVLPVIAEENPSNMELSGDTEESANVGGSKVNPNPNSEISAKKPVSEKDASTKKPIPATTMKKVAPKSGEKLKAFLGDMKPTLETATKIEVYQVGSQLAGEGIPEESQLGGYPVLKEPTVLSAEQLKHVKALVLDDKSYFWGPPHKKCLIAPSVGFRFIKGSKEVAVLLSTYCNQWTFVYEGKNMGTQDYAPSAKVIDELLVALFPDGIPE